MSDSMHKRFPSCFAVVYIFAMVCLVESRPRSGGPRVALAQEAITDWLSRARDVILPISNGSISNSDSYQTGKETATAHSRILNHPRRSSNERINGPFPDSNSRPGNSGSQSRKEDSMIHFPSDGHHEHQPRPTKDRIREDSFEPATKMFEGCADGSTYCETIDDYPLRRVKEIFENDIGKFKGFFGNDKVLESSLVHRIDDANESPLCVSQETIVFPKVGKNEQNNLLYIVNDDEYTQGVRVEKCHKMGPCAFSDNFPNGYRAMCKQKHIYRRLLALNGAGQPQPDSFLFPSCCVCSVKIDPPLASRMGFPLKPNMSPVQRNKTPTTNTKNSGSSAALAAPESDSQEDYQKDAPDVANSSSKVESVQSPHSMSSKIVFSDHLKPLPLTPHSHNSEEDEQL